MGWLWSSPSDGVSSAPKEARNDTDAPPAIGLTEEQKRRIFGKRRTTQDADRSQDIGADRELEDFLNSFAESDSIDAQVTKAQALQPPSEYESEQRNNQDRILSDGSLDISPSALHPRTMSCTQAYDQARYCSSMGGRFHSYYRYGSVQPCSEQWGAFWFCMRTRTLPQQEREKRIVDYYEARDARRKKEFGSSESVWQIRKEPVQRAFHKDPDAQDENVAEFKE